MVKILILAANPNDTARLRLDQEVRDIREGLQRAQNRANFELIHKSAVRPRDIQRALLDESPQIVHFSGHGEGEEGLVFEDDLGNAKLIGSEALAGLFELFANTIECVLLNGCYSKVQAESLVKHIDYVIGMRQTISDFLAIEFAVSFYDALGAGQTYEFAYKFACNGVQLNASTSEDSIRLTPFKKLQVKGTGEHLIPVLLKRSELLGVNPSINQYRHLETEKMALENNLDAVVNAGEARIASLEAKIAVEENKLQASVEQHVKEAVDWLKNQEKSLANSAKEHALSKISDSVINELSEMEKDDFQWEIEQYIESVYSVS